MADALSILATAYKTTTPITPGKYVPVDAEAYNGSWKGTYANGKKFEVAISQVNGFRAQVQYKSEGTVKYQQVLIKDNSFRVGDTKFQMTADNKATIKNVVTDAASGGTYLDTAFAIRDT